MARLSALGLSLDAWGFHPQMPDIIDLARAFPGSNIIVGHCGGPLGYGRYAGKQDEVFADWKASVTELAKCPERDDETGRDDDAPGGLRLHGAGRAALVGATRRALAPVRRNLHRIVRCRTAAWPRATSRSRRWASASPRCSTR